MVRVLLVVAAAICVAWFGLAAHQAHDTQRATTLLASGHRLPAAQAHEVSGLLTSAGHLNPDRQVDVLRAELANDQGQRTRAQAIARSVISAEPQNLRGWALVAQSAPNFAAVKAAYARIEVLINWKTG